MYKGFELNQLLQVVGSAHSTELAECILWVTLCYGKCHPQTGKGGENGRMAQAVREMYKAIELNLLHQLLQVVVSP